MARTMNPKTIALQDRTRRFATAVIKFCEQLPSDVATQTIVEQLLDSSGSTDSNYRAACRARSSQEFIAKVGVAAEEADESHGWLQLLVDADLATIENARGLIRESNELTAIFVASRKTAQRHQQARQQRKEDLKAINVRRRSK